MNKIRRDDRGFSLVELLAVLAIIAILVTISVSAIPGLRSTYNRKSAVDLIMTTVEQARVDALQSGENVYVILALALDSGVSPDALIVAGDQPIGSTQTGEVLYTRWVKLPQNVRFLTSKKTLVTSSSSSYPSTWGTGINNPLPALNGKPISLYTTSYLQFNSTGTLVVPVGGPWELALYEGTRSALGAQTALGPSAAATKNLGATGLYEVIHWSQYTGRSWMDVSSP